MRGKGLYIDTGIHIGLELGLIQESLTNPTYCIILKKKKTHNILMIRKQAATFFRIKSLVYFGINQGAIFFLVRYPLRNTNITFCFFNEEKCRERLAILTTSA